MSGMSLTAIAAEFDIDVATASRRCRGIPRPEGILVGRARTFDYAKAARLKASGLSAKTLALRFGVHANAIHKAARLEAAQ